MSSISDMQPQKKNPKRVNIFIDGEFAFGISRESKIINKLKIQDSLSDIRIQNLIFNDQVERLLGKAIKFLSYRPRSEKEIRDNLLQKLKLTDKAEEEKKNFEKSIEEVIKKIKKIGQIDDREFAKWWVDQRTRFKKMSPRIIKSELWKKGIDKELIDEILTESNIDQYSLALEAAKKKLSSYKSLDKVEFKTKMSRFLASRGFSWEGIKKVVDTLSESR